jgi:regulator of ribonuclease activity A
LSIPTADLCDEYGDAVRVLEGGFASYGGVVAFGGPVSTVVAPEDNSLVRDAVAEPGAGRVLVVAGDGSTRCALVGGNLAVQAAANGWLDGDAVGMEHLLAIRRAGIVVDGCVRDAPELAEARVGIRARGTCPRRSVKRGLGERDVTVAVAGAELSPGMWLWADEDGMVVAAGPLGSDPA